MKRTITYMVLGMAIYWPCLSKVALAQLVSGPGWTAETKTAPAVAYFNGDIYYVWKGQSGTNIWYSSSSASQQRLGATTPDAPALAAAGSTLYAAWHGENNNDIYYSTNAGSGFTAGPHPQVNNGLGTYAETIAAPALAGYGSTIYVAWTTASDTIMLASYAGTGSSWTFYPTAAPGSTTLAPALTVYGGTLYLAWVNGSNDVMLASASLPLSSSGPSWSPVSQVKGSTWTAQTSVAPALGVSTVAMGTDPGLYVAWTAPNSGGTAFTTNYSQFTGSEWNGPILVPNPPDPAPANATPALLSYTVYTSISASTYFDAVYTTASDDIDLAVLEAHTVLKKPPKCCPDCCQ